MKHALITLRAAMRQGGGSLRETTLTTAGWLEDHPDLPDHVVIWGSPDRSEEGLGLSAEDLISVTPIPSRPYE